MFIKAIFLFAALYVHSAYSSHYQGPVANPVVLHSGYLADTHEVAAAKSAHLATLAHQSYGHGYGGAYSYGNGHGYGNGHRHGYEGAYSYGSGNGHHGDYRYHGPIAIPHVLHDGHIADTHEVAVAKAEHFAAVAKAKAHGEYGHYDGGYSQYAGGYGHSYSGVHYTPYHGPLARPVVLHSGYLADTHEVAAAKQHHLHALHVGHSGHQYGIH